MALDFVIALLAFSCCLQLCQCSGTIEVKFDEYDSSCSDNSFLDNACDTSFLICLKKAGGAKNGRNCNLGRFGPSSEHSNTNHIVFTTNVGGIQNPVKRVISPSFESNSFMVVMEVRDEELLGYEVVANLGTTVTYAPKKNEESATWTHDFTRSGSYKLWFQYRAYCNAYFYGSDCGVECRARNDASGHYWCDPDTGEKKCHPGWTGENCTVDINECDQGPCYNNAECFNLPGTYTCKCPPYYTGKNCNLVNSLCHSRPCQNNGTCSGDMDVYNCTCPFQWTGEDCEIQVDFCETNPCQNNATCFGTLGRYHCTCTAGWTGKECDVEVDACDSSPCQNGGTCGKEPRAEYNCSCPEMFEGDDCQTLRDPCRQNPCVNSGKCQPIDYFNYRCDCVYGYSGERCEKLIPVPDDTKPGAVAQRQDPEDSGGVGLPIGLSILSLFIIVLCILVLLFLRRRRKQKEAQAQLADQESRGDIVQVTGTNDNLAFQNALYNDTNRANAIRDQNNRPALPLPQTPAAGDFDYNYPVKPKKLPEDEDEERGAVGGVGCVPGPNPYQDVDGYLDPVNMRVKDTKQKTAAGTGPYGLDTRTLAGGRQNDEKGAANPYADFEELKRRSMAARQISEDNSLTIPALGEGAEENHYHDLDEVCLSMEAADTDPKVQFTPAPALPPTNSAYDIPGRRSNDSAPVRTSDSSTGSGSGFGSHYDSPPSRSSDGEISPLPVFGSANGYMDMNGGPSRPVGAEPDVDPLESTDEEDEAVDQEDLNRLRHEVLKTSAASVADN